MEIRIKDEEGHLLVGVDIENMEEGLIGQTIAELEIIKIRLLNLYENRGDTVGI